MFIALECHAQHSPLFASKYVGSLVVAQLSSRFAPAFKSLSLIYKGIMIYHLKNVAF